MKDHYWKGLWGPSRSGARAWRPVATALVRTLWSVRTYGRHHVPASGPVILASNHTGILDGPLLYGVTPRPVHTIVKYEIFRGVVGRALTALGQIPVDRFRTDIAAVKNALAVLEREDVLAIYPEGERGAGDFTSIKPGVAYLALCTGAPVVPVACLGIRESGRSTGSLPPPRARLDVVFGRPFRVEPIAWPRDRVRVREHAAALGEQLIAHLRHALQLTGGRLP